MNNVSILFSWHKSSEEFIKRDNFLPRKKLLTSETNGELKGGGDFNRSPKKR